MPPRGKIHDVGKSAEHAVRTCGDLCRAFIHKCVYVFSERSGFFFFFGTKSVAVPSHKEAGFKCERFVLPQRGLSVTVDANVTAVVNFSACGIVFVLPKCSAENRRIVRFRRSDADRAELRVASADDERRAFFETRFFFAFAADAGGKRTAFFRFGKYIAF